MKKLIALLFLGFALGLVVPQSSSAQDVLNGVYIKKRDKDRKPIPYRPIVESDIAWGKFVIRMIDLREKVNLPLYYPTEPIQERMSLIDLLLYGIKDEGSIVPFNPDGWAGDEFDVPMTWSEIETKFNAKDDTSTSYDPTTGEPIEVIVEGQMNTFEVKQYMVKEMWFFDRKHSALEVRIIGLCPIREYIPKASGELSAESQALAEEMSGEVKKERLFWVHFQEARPVLANHEVFNPLNDAESRTFDDIFFKRKFASYIIQESNVYDNRDINKYSLGSGTLQESERVYKAIFTYEQSLWEY